MLSWILPDARGATGGARVLRGQLEALRARHDVVVAAFAGPDPSDRAALARLRADGVEAHVVWRATPVGLERWRRRWRLAVRWAREDRPLKLLEFHEVAMQALVDRLAGAGGFDLVQVETTWMAGYALPGATATVLSEHDVASVAGPMDGAPPPGWRGLLLRRDAARWRRHLAAAWRRADRVLVFTDREAAFVGALAPDVAGRVRVNPFGVDLPPPPGEPEAPDEVLFVGGFGHPPNRDAALWLAKEIMPRVWAARPGARLTVVGADPPPELVGLAGPRVVVAGRVDRVEPFLARAAVVVAPLRSGGGMRVKVAEALAHGKAVVATRLGADGIPAADPPALLTAETAEGLADAVVGLLASEPARRELGRRARALVADDLSWAAYGRRLDLVYGELRPMTASAR